DELVERNDVRPREVDQRKAVAILVRGERRAGVAIIDAEARREGAAEDARQEVLRRGEDLVRRDAVAARIAFTIADILLDPQPAELALAVEAQLGQPDGRADPVVELVGAGRRQEIEAAIVAALDRVLFRIEAGDADRIAVRIRGVDAAAPIG